MENENERNQKQAGGVTENGAAGESNVSKMSSGNREWDEEKGVEAVKDKERTRNIIIAVVASVILAGALGTALVLNYLHEGNTAGVGSNTGSTGEIVSNSEPGTTVTESEVKITKSGTYTLNGDYTSVTIDTSGDVKLILDSANITSASGPAIYVIDAGSVSIELKGESTITANNTTDELEGVIHSTDDLIFSGDGSLTVNGNNDGIVSKDALTIKSGTYIVNTMDDCIKGKDSVVISGGTFNLTSTEGDAIKATNEEDAKLGLVTINGGTFNIKVADDAIHAITKVTINGGTFDINAHEGLEGTYITVNDGEIKIVATDDAVNAAAKSAAYTPTFEMNGGSLTIDMGQGDTDAIDCNGNLVITGGTIDITAQFAFDFDGTVTFTGGTVTVNGEKLTTITNSMMMGGGMMGPGGQAAGQQNAAATQGTAQQQSTTRQAQRGAMMQR